MSETPSTYIFTFHNVSINTRMLFEKEIDEIYFTFHNVSINTTADDVITALIPSLHSTMFLLILDGKWKTELSCLGFTFHNVSINTEIVFTLSTVSSSLHSTMFLLILYLQGFTAHGLFFTFHNVSINTIPDGTTM